MGSRRLESRLPSGDAPEAVVDSTHDHIAGFVDRLLASIFAGESRRARARGVVLEVGTELSPREAADHFEAHYDAVLTLIDATVQALSSFGWLWYLRRLPRSVFEHGADLESTAPYDIRLAAILAGRSARDFASDDASTPAGRMTYPLDDQRLEFVLRFCARVMLLSDIERQYRRAAKGARYMWAEHGLERIPDAELEEAIASYDARQEIARRPMLAGGRMVEFLGTGALDQEPDTVILACALRPEPGPVITLPLPGRVRDPHIAYRGQYVPIYAGVDTLLEVLGVRASVAPLDVDFCLPELIALLAVLGVEALIQGDQYILTSLQRTGYVIRDMTRFEEAYAQLLVPETRAAIESAFECSLPSTASELVDCLRGVEGAPRPMVPGPVIRDLATGCFAIDVDMASQRLIMAGSGRARAEVGLRNTIAFGFEDTVNEAVAALGKAPTSSEVAGLKRRELRLNGAAITDLDAIAEVDGQLLLISCKSVAYTPDIRSGLHAPVRNAADELQKAVRLWRNKLAILSVNPHGDNYDFRSWSLLGVVVTPTIHWAGTGIVLDAAMTRPDGRVVPWVCSLEELESFLGGADP